jgi:hypothetical protein
VDTVLIALVGLVGLAWPVAATTDGGAEVPVELRAQVEALEVTPISAGQAGELSLILLEPPDRALPLEIRVADNALEFDDNRFGWAAVVDPLATQPRVRASFRAPTEPGEYEVRASVDYSVCGEAWCRRKHAQIRWLVTVD